MTTRFSQLCRLCLGAVFCFTAFAHLKNPFLFLDSVLAYQLVNGYAAVAVAGILPVVELTLGIFFLVTATRTIPFWVAYGLFAVFFVAQGYAILNGIQIDCGCFGGVINRNVGSGSMFFLAVLVTTCAMGHLTLSLEKKDDKSRVQGVV